MGNQGAISRPWEQSTGPKSEAGKARAARNAWKGGERELLRQLRAELGRDLDLMGDALNEVREAIDRVRIQ